MESSMQSGARQGMCTLHDHLLRLYNRGVIASDVALEYAPNRTEMEKALANTVSGF